MNQDNPTKGDFNSGSTGEGNRDSGSFGSPAGGNSTGSMGGSTSSPFGTGSTVGTTSSSEIETCAHCGSTLGKGQNSGIEQFLAKIGISDEMVTNLKTSMENIDIEEYLNTAREYLKTTGNKATTFTKENPGKIAAGVAVLAVGAGLLISSLGKDEKRR